MFKRLMYYGYDKDVYRSVKELRDQTDRRSTLIVRIMCPMIRQR